MNYEPHKYQDHATTHILNHSYCGLFLDMGLGKTVATLTAICDLLNNLAVTKILIIAPLRVAEETWPVEIKKWDHTKHLKYSLVLGSIQERLKGLYAPADIYIINRENVPWLVSQMQSAWNFDMVVIDELSSFKSSQAIRFRSLRMVRPKINRVVGLTGTPAPNGLIDLWPQLYLLDMGERLGKTVSGYRNTYFRPDKTNGHIVYSYKIKKQGEEMIYQKIGDICISMSAKDYLELPERINNYVSIKLKDYQRYKDFEKEEIIKIIDHGEITAMSAAGLVNKLLQFANGALYDEEKNIHEIHDQKIEALQDIIMEAQGQPVLVFYSYQSDYIRIQKKIKGTILLKSKEDIEKWNCGNVPVLLAHPASAGHGLNLQSGGHIIVWFGPTWSQELYAQANARLDRQGQTKTVIVHHLIADGTKDLDVIKSLDKKQAGQDELLEAVKVRILEYKKYLHANKAV